MMNKNLLYSSIKVILPLLLGSGILIWMYRDFNFIQIENVLKYDVKWEWMIFSIPFGIFAQTFRGWRWKQTLDPMGETVRNSVSVNSIFISYAISLIIPRSGEFIRCGILNRYDKVPITKALGTVVMERAIDSIIVLIVTLITIITQIPIFIRFFNKTGTRLDSIFTLFTPIGWFVTLVCFVVAIIFIGIILKHLSTYGKIKSILNSIWTGIKALRSVRNIPLFIFYSIGIWVSYFLHFYLTFFCFSATSELSITCVLICFVVGSIAVIVPTPNGAGPWHFAVKTMLILYGIADIQALYFVLVVHTIQTLLVILLGIYAWIALLFTKHKTIQ